MDKIKSQAEQVAARAQEGSVKVQAKIGDMQSKRAGDALLRDLGAAYYAEARRAGPHDAVEKALAALDTHAAEQGPIDLTTTGPQPAPSQSAPDAASGAQPAGDFKLEDL
ncbi:MAG TPA: hypothetical protein VFH50_14595 [Acidimicrobiales bacterium]|nr:hypothetical protein [Acidimicrobiales bacterium]